MNNCINRVLLTYDEPGHWHCIAGYGSYLALAGLTVAALLGAWLCAHDLHVRFWLGEVPELSLVALAAALGLSLLTIRYTSWVRSWRTQARHHRHEGSKSSDAPWALSLRGLRAVFFLLGFTGFGALGLGLVTVHFGRELSLVLSTRCGRGGTTRAIDRIDQKLRVFRIKCHHNPADRWKPVDQCPDYSEAFPPPAPYAEYLKLMEADYGCTGFCERGQKTGPLFVQPVGTPARKRPTCATFLGHHLWKISLMAGMPSAIIGLCLAMFGAALLLYEDL